MENKLTVNEFFSSKGKSIEEVVGQEVEGTFEPEVEQIHPWWEKTVSVLKNKEVDAKEYKD